jgi:hypothetical protein
LWLLAAVVVVDIKQVAAELEDLELEPDFL